MSTTGPIGSQVLRAAARASLDWRVGMWRCREGRLSSRDDRTLGKSKSPRGEDKRVCQKGG